MERPEPAQRRELQELKSIIDKKWGANEGTLIKSLSQGMITWRQLKDGGFEVKIKPELS